MQILKEESVLYENMFKDADELFKPYDWGEDISIFNDTAQLIELVFYLVEIVIDYIIILVYIVKSLSYKFIIYLIFPLFEQKVQSAASSQ